MPGGVPAHTGTPPAADWKRPPGRPRRNWLQQVEEDDYVVLRTMLLFSRVDVTLHAGGGTPGGCSVYGLQRGNWL